MVEVCLTPNITLDLALAVGTVIFATPRASRNSGRRDSMQRASSFFTPGSTTDRWSSTYE